MDVWSSLRFLVGDWEGQSTGKPGTGTTNRQYRLELGNKFLIGNNRIVYAIRPGQSEPEIHEDRSIFSFERAAKTFVLRQFHVEGFVNEYVLENTASDGKMLEFVTRHIENIQEGWRAREVYRVVSPSEFTETFSLAAPGKDFEIYSESRLKRRP